MAMPSLALWAHDFSATGCEALDGSLELHNKPRAYGTAARIKLYKSRILF